MCQYVREKELKGRGKPRNVFHNWINDVHIYMRKRHKIRFDCHLIGSGSRNMVVRKCNEENYFDLDYQIVLKRIPSGTEPSVLKKEFKAAFDMFKPMDFCDCKDRSQSLRTKSSCRGYGFDIIITKVDENGEYHILFNKKDSNDANNKDYSWLERKDMSKYKAIYNIVAKDEKMDGYLRQIYISKRHEYRNQTEPNKKKAYQILNEALVETLTHFKIKL
ncbi:MAG: hypothetical protein J6Y28_08950 [Acholeplasmatales bacterium]|nr:hypothetical protein [Acholeplasmatales bacterium]